MRVRRANVLASFGRLWCPLLLLPILGCEAEGADAPSASSSGSVEVPSHNPYADTPSRFGAVPLHAGFSPDPRVVSGEAVGEVEARSLHRRCRGWISALPDYLLEADTAFFRLYVLARSLEDVSLVVRKPNGKVICNDDRYGGRDPMVRGNFPMGSTQVWVGVKDEGATALYRLGFSEMKWKPSTLALPEPG